MGVLKGMGLKGKVVSQYKLTVGKTFGESARAVEQWRFCTGIELLCKEDRTVGGGWSPPSPVSLGLAGNGVFIGQTVNGSLQLTPGQGGLVTTYSVVPPDMPRAAPRQWKPGTFINDLCILSGVM